MEKFKFEDLEVYQRSQNLVKEVPILTRNWPKEYQKDLLYRELTEIIWMLRGLRRSLR